MAKWTIVRQDRLPKTENSEKNFRNAIHNVKSLTSEELKKAGDENFKRKVENENNLLSAEEKIKSENLKKQIANIKALRAKASKSEGKHGDNKSESKTNN